LAVDSPYNTRTHAGLPPGPIDSPGLASIEAAAQPAKGDYLFYVVEPGACNKLAFSKTEAEFEADVARYNEAREAAGGNSPTSCGE
ncbi:MAG: endolytic transglycosylase MltG, partial [Thermoleophilia bacterium]